MTNQPVCVYRVYDSEDRVLYVGATANPKQRMGIHRSSSDWWPLHARYEEQWFDNSNEASAAEEQAIRELKPPFNKAGLDRKYVPHDMDRYWVVRDGVRYPRGEIPDAERVSLQEKVEERDEARQELIAAVKAAKDAGGSIRDIAELTGRSTNTIQRWLREPHT